MEAVFVISLPHVGYYFLNISPVAKKLYFLTSPQNSL